MWRKLFWVPRKFCASIKCNQVYSNSATKNNIDVTVTWSIGSMTDAQPLSANCPAYKLHGNECGGKARQEV